MRRPARTLLVLAMLSAPARAQDEPPRPTLEGNPIPNFIAALSFLSVSEEISGASYRVHNGNEFEDDTTFSTIKLPWEQDVDVCSDLGTLYVDAALGYLSAEDHFHAATALGDLTLDQDWRVIAGRLGLGFTFELSETWKLRPSVGVAITHVDNDATYSELGEQILAPVLDGVFTNWSAWAATGAASLTAIHERQMDELHLLVRGKFSYLYTDVFEATSPEQAQDDTGEIVTLRGDLDGPTPWCAFRRPIGWTVFGVYSSFLGSTGSTIGFNDLFEVGGGFRIPLPRLFDDVLLSGGYLFGPNISGSTFGLSVSF